MEATEDVQTIIAEIQRGDSARFSELYEILVDRVYAYVRYRTNNNELATDITQDVFIDMYRALGTFTYHSRSQFYAFVFTITKRKLARHYTSFNKEMSERVDGVDDALLADSPSTVETDDVVNRALESLDEETREIVVLHHWSRFTFSEIATFLDLTETAVRTRHHRALKSLANHLT